MKNTIDLKIFSTKERNKKENAVTLNSNEILNKIVVSDQDQYFFFITLLGSSLIVYAILILENTLKFESTFLIFFFSIFVVLLYQNIYHFIIIELNNYSFNIYLLFKETTLIKIDNVKKTLNYLKIARNLIYTSNDKKSLLYLYKILKNFIYIKKINNLTVLFLINHFLLKAQFKKQLILI